MFRRRILNLTVVVAFCGTALTLRAQPFGLSNRVANTTLRMPSAPPAFGYSLTNAFGTLSFTAPLALASPQGETNRLFVVERAGRIVVITNLSLPTRTVFLDISSRVLTAHDCGLQSMTFHPGFATNGYFFLFYSLVTNTAAGTGTHQRIARFQVDTTNPNQALASSELPLITAYDEANDHNGGDVQFGPDGYLYVTMGDEGTQYDRLNNSQRIDKDFWSSILRLDVDKRPGSIPPHSHPASSTNYAIPSDNPFIGFTTFNGVPVVAGNIRTEMFAVGLREPWRITFDALTGLLYCGDVGQDRWEEINIIVRGGNYGWAFRDGMGHAGPKAAPAGVTNVIDPIFEYGHGTGTNQGLSITGGVVYRGRRNADLYGSYIFSDYESGNVWRLRYDGTNVSHFQRLDVNAGLVGFGIDPATGDVLAADFQEGRIKRLVYSTVSGPPLPPTLADTGVFADLMTLTPHAGIVPYELNVPFWSDGAVKQRWFSITGLTQRMTFQTTNYWTLPSGAVWIKHFELELTNGIPESRRRLETRLLVRDNTEAGVYGVTYRWGNSLTNATLIGEDGLDEPLTINDGGTVRTQVWHYPTRGECMICHNSAARGVLGFGTAQMNRTFDYRGTVDNQLRALSHANYFSNPVTNLNRLPALASPTDENVSVEYRVRSYLMANCAQCHLPGGPGQGGFDTRIWTPLSAANLVAGGLNNNGGDPDNRVLVPGSSTHSMLLTRISTRGPGQMPPLASAVLDTQAIALVKRWITNELRDYVSFAAWQSNYFGSTAPANARPDADPDHDGAPNRLEWLTATSPINPLDPWQAGIQRSNDVVLLTYPRLPHRGFEVQWTWDLASPAWSFLDVPQNRPVYSNLPGTAAVPDLVTNLPTKYYRVRVFEP